MTRLSNPKALRKEDQNMGFLKAPNRLPADIPTKMQTTVALVQRRSDSEYGLLPSSCCQLRPFNQPRLVLDPRNKPARHDQHEHTLYARERVC